MRVLFCALVIAIIAVVHGESEPKRCKLPAQFSMNLSFKTGGVKIEKGKEKPWYYRDFSFYTSDRKAQKDASVEKEAGNKKIMWYIADYKKGDLWEIVEKEKRCKRLGTPIYMGEDFEIPKTAKFVGSGLAGGVLKVNEWDWIYAHNDSRWDAGFADTVSFTNSCIPMVATSLTRLYRKYAYKCKWYGSDLLEAVDYRPKAYQPRLKVPSYCKKEDDKFTHQQPEELEEETPSIPYFMRRRYRLLNPRVWSVERQFAVVEEY